MGKMVVFMRPVLIFTGELAMLTIFSGQLAFVGTVGNFLGKIPDFIGGNWRKSVKLMGDGLTSVTWGIYGLTWGISGLTWGINGLTFRVCMLLH